MDLIGPYTLKGKDGSAIDFMCLTMIDPTSSCFEIVELPLVTPHTSPDNSIGSKAHKTMMKDPYFDKSSRQISSLVNKTWFSRYP